LEYLAIGGRIILKLVLKKLVVRSWSRLIWLRIEAVGGLM
jgi:hypothetical protein